MTHPASAPPDRILELLADRALFGLDDADSSELARISPNRAPDTIDALDLAAGAAAVVMLGRDAHTAMPEAVARRARIAASAWEVARSIPASPRPDAPPIALTPRADSTSLSWWLAAAACIAVAAFAWVRQSRQLSPAEIAIDDRREILIAEAQDLVRIPWTATEDPAAAAGVSGDVVWSDARNEGYMRIAGLAHNDPAIHQYQLWVFDSQRDERYPVDGGIFDIPPGDAEVIIPITTKIRVAEATLFAVTVEQPGGVVVSSRQRLPILAQVATQ